MLVTVLLVVIYFAVPAGAIAACKRSKALNALSPVVLCYIVGIILANQPWLAVDQGLAQNLAAGVVLLAICILLLPVDFRAWLRLAKVTTLSCGLCVASVAVTSAFGALIFAGSIPESWKVAGMLVGVYSGGTANMASIGTALHVNPQTFITVHTSDVVICGVYFLMLVSIGPRFFGLFLRPFKSSGGEAADAIPLERHQSLLTTIAVVGLGVLLVGAAVGLAQVVPEEFTEAVAVMTVTTSAIALSFSRKIRAMALGSGAGDYLLYVFCVAVGSLASFTELANAPLNVFLYTGLVVIGSVAVHAALCRALSIDRDTAVITSTAALYGPAFVGPVAKKMKNPEIVVSGITSGLVGLAVGNYLGLAVAYVTRFALNLTR